MGVPHPLIPHHTKQFSINKWMNKYKGEQTSHTSLYIPTENQLPAHKALITRNKNLNFSSCDIRIHQPSYASNNVLTQKSRYRWIDAVIMWLIPQTKSYFHHCKLIDPIKTGGNSEMCVSGKQGVHTLYRHPPTVNVSYSIEVLSKCMAVIFHQSRSCWIQTVYPNQKAHYSDVCNVYEPYVWETFKSQESLHHTFITHHSVMLWDASDLISFFFRGWKSYMSRAALTRSPDGISPCVCVLCLKHCTQLFTSEARFPNESGDICHGCTQAEDDKHTGAYFLMKSVVLQISITDVDF